MGDRVASAGPGGTAVAALVFLRWLARGDAAARSRGRVYPPWMEAGAAFSPLDDPRAAIDDALRQLRAFGRADLAILFATSEHAEEIRALSARIRAGLGQPVLVGASTSGVISSAGEHEDQPGLGLLALRGVRASATLAFDAEALRTALAAPFALAFPDPRRIDASVVEAIETSPVPLAGGGIAGSGQSLFALAGSTSGEGGCAVATLDGCSAQVVVAHGVQTAGAFRAVTRARRNAILEIEGRPAPEALAAHIRASPGGTEQLGNLLFLALRRAGEAGHVVRPIVGVDAAAGALLLPEELPANVEVAFGMRETLGAVRALHTALEEVRARGPVDAALYFNCAGRGSRLHLEPDADLHAIRRALPDVPLLGMTSSFELARVGAFNRMLMYSGVLVALRSGG